MHRPDPLPRATLKAAAILLGLRGALMSVVELELLWRTGEMFTRPLALIALVFWLGVGNAGWQTWRGGAGSGRAVALAAAILGTVAAGRLAWWLNTRSILSNAHLVERQVGAFPYKGDTEREVWVMGERTTARIGADGTRRCPGTPAEGVMTVALVGDSFIFGKGVEDEGTLCAHLARMLAEAGYHDIRLLNLGQPGANAWSYADTVRFAGRAHEVDHAFVAFLFTDDANVLDLNAVHNLLATRTGQVLSAVLDPEVLGGSFPMVFEGYTTGYALHLLVDHGMRAVAEASEVVPVSAWLYGARGLPLTHQASTLAALDDASATFASLGVLTPEDVSSAFIEGDGHPTAEGQAWYAARLLPEVIALREAL